MVKTHNHKESNQKKTANPALVEEASYTEHNKGIYYKYYKQLLIIPIAMLLIAMILIGHQYYTTGDFMNKGISLKGGTSFTISSNSANIADISIRTLEANIKANHPNADIEIRDLKDLMERKAISIDVDIEDETELDSFKTTLLTQFPDLTLAELNGDVQTTGASLGNAFFKQIMIALIIAFIFMSIVVFIQFRLPIPSFTVILCAFSDIVVTLAIVNLMGVKIGTAGISAFLMLIGYSVDTDILLSSRVLNGKIGTVYDRVITSVKTGMLMTGTTLAALIVALIFSTSPVISQIMLILLIGLLVDLVYTWIQNVAILRIYMDRRERK